RAAEGRAQMIAPHALFQAALGAAIALAALGGVPGIFLDRGSAAAERVATGASLLASALGLFAAVLGLFAPADRILDAPAGVLGARLALAIDPLSAAFLLPIFAVSGLGAIYGLGYWPSREQPESAARLRFFYGLLTAAMAVVALARDGVIFLVAWE